MIFNSTLNWLFFIGFYYLLVRKAGKTFPILNLFIFTYYIQYIFSTFLIYNNFSQLQSYMEIDQSIYFLYALPAFLSLFLGITLFGKKFDFIRLHDKIDQERASQLAIVSIGISYLFDFFPVSGLSSITEYLKYCGAIFLLFSNLRFRYIFLVLIFVQFFLTVLEQTIFINFFAWSTFLFFMFSIKHQFSFVTRSSFLILAVPVLITVQSVKTELRRFAWKGREKVTVELFTELAERKQAQNAGLSFWQSQGVVRTVGRLTQGWHLGLVLRWVPLKVPFVKGEEFITDIRASLLPRFFFPDKKVIGGKEKFKKFTGHKLWNNTSMTIGVIGDFYINFGVIGSFIALFLFGGFLALFVNYFNSKYVQRNPIDIVWLPFIFNYLMRANNDFYAVINGLLKGLIIMMVVKYIVKTIWPETMVEASETVDKNLPRGD